MGQRSNVDNLGYLNALSMNRADSRFTTVSGAFHIGLHFAQTEVVSDLSAILSCHLGCIRSILL